MKKSQPSPGIYEALGRDGQRIIVWPSKNIVVVFTGGGFEPGDIGEFIVEAVRSDQAITENNRGLEALLKRVKDAASPPSPRPLNELPGIVQQVNDKEYICDDNAIGFKRISLSFRNKEEGLIRIIRDKSTLEIPFGLDDVYRISPTGDFGLPRASKGVWRAGNELVLYLYQTSRMDLDEMTLTFENDSVIIEIDGTAIKGRHE
jgi:hypothetical protein